MQERGIKGRGGGQGIGGHTVHTHDTELALFRNYTGNSASCLRWPKNDPFIERSSRKPKLLFASSLHLVTSLLHHQHRKQHPALAPSTATTPSTWPLPQWPPPVGSHVLPNTKEMCKLWSMLRGYTTLSVVDEAFHVGNTIVSMLQNFFEVCGVSKQDVHLHTDNCGGQIRTTAW